MATQQTDGPQHITDEQLKQLRAHANEVAVREARLQSARADLHVHLARCLQAANADPTSEIDLATGEIRPRRAP